MRLHKEDFEILKVIGRGAFGEVRLRPVPRPPLSPSPYFTIQPGNQRKRPVFPPWPRPGSCLVGERWRLRRRDGSWASREARAVFQSAAARPAFLRPCVAQLPLLRRDSTRTSDISDIPPRSEAPPGRSPAWTPSQPGFRRWGRWGRRRPRVLRRACRSTAEANALPRAPAEGMRACGTPDCSLFVRSVGLTLANAAAAALSSFSSSSEAFSGPPCRPELPESELLFRVLRSTSSSAEGSRGSGGGESKHCRNVVLV